MSFVKVYIWLSESFELFPHALLIRKIIWITSLREGFFQSCLQSMVDLCDKY